MKTLVMISAMTLSCFAAAPAIAKPARTADASAAAATMALPVATQGEARRYCIVDTPTGTRIQRKDCRTRADWLKEGFDPLDPK